MPQCGMEGGGIAMLHVCVCATAGCLVFGVRCSVFGALAMVMAMTLLLISANYSSSRATHTATQPHSGAESKSASLAIGVARPLAKRSATKRQCGSYRHAVRLVAAVARPRRSGRWYWIAAALAASWPLCSTNAVGALFGNLQLATCKLACGKRWTIFLLPVWLYFSLLGCWGTKQIFTYLSLMKSQNVWEQILSPCHLLLALLRNVKCLCNNLQIFT